MIIFQKFPEIPENDRTGTTMLNLGVKKSEKLVSAPVIISCVHSALAGSVSCTHEVTLAFPQAFSISEMLCSRYQRNGKWKSTIYASSRIT